MQWKKKTSSKANYPDKKKPVYKERNVKLTLLYIMHRTYCCVCLWVSE